MLLDEIREKIAELLSQHSEWVNKLNDTEPGNYGIEDYDVSVTKDDIYVDIPSRTFTFKNVEFSFTAVLGGSNDGFNVDAQKTATGTGTFEFVDGSDNILLEEIEIQVDLDLIG